MGRRRERRDLTDQLLRAAWNAPPGSLPPLAVQLSDAQSSRTWTIPVTSLPAVVACRTLIADTMGQLQLVAIRDGQPLPAQPPVVRRPDPSEPTWLTWHRLGMALTGAGHGYVLVTSWDATDRPASTKVLDPSLVRPELNELGEVTSVVWQDRRFAVPLEVVHIPNIVDHDQVGVGPLQMCAAVFLQTAELYGFRGSYYSDGGVPSVKIIVPNRLTTEQANAERDAYVRVALRPAHPRGGLRGHRHRAVRRDRGRG